MNATQLAQNAYGTGTRSVQTPRGIEYEAFARVTSRLKAVATQLAKSKRKKQAVRRRGGSSSAVSCVVSNHFGELTAALHENSTLWTILASDVANAQNGLPEEVRAGIFSLAEFTRQHTTKVLKSEASVVPLLEINIAVMRGLGAQSSARPNAQSGSLSSGQSSGQSSVLSSLQTSAPSTVPSTVKSNAQSNARPRAANANASSASAPKSAVLS